MSQIFGRGANTAARIALPSLVIVPVLILATLIFFRWTDYVTGEDRIVDQPVAFSHRHHTSEVGIDCRYCHTSVTEEASAGLPPTKTCMTCHSRLWSEEEMLQPIRTSWVTGERLRWNRVHDLPDHVYFNHSTHVTNGVACTQCHGPVGDMRLIGQEAPLTMGWCLDCHRDPGPNLSPPEEIFAPMPTRRAKIDAAAIHALLRDYDIEAGNLTDCTTCHR
ncbi:cytochrome c3 family protein [Roseivivax sediminis]|uniref:Class III cytochrome C family protein n=1 Tax=Roseivivax sediminis TaxID=936889 RepID=A0A1I1X954_9RHOB|nr:cytochrome c3 family protein [Roseivivax sediminis]SFE01880.1 Class III cytochrome C family protein [Roseivivax sediminis]